LTSAGDVGVGTAAPGFKVEVVGGTNDGIHIKDAASATVFGGLFTQSAALALVTRSNHALDFGSNDTTHMSLSSAGALTIGTAGGGWGGAANGRDLTIHGGSETTTGVGQISVQATDAIGVNIGGGISFGGEYQNDANVDWATLWGRKENATDGNTAGYMQFNTRPHGGNMTERGRLTSLGVLLIGTTSLYSAPKVGIGYNGGTDNGIVLFSSSSAAASCISFFVSNTTHVGNITTNGSNSTAYNTSSDYRLKENVEYNWDATTRLKQLKPARFNFINKPDEMVDGFMAHEAQEVVPRAVTGTKDEVDDDGNPVIQGIDQAKLVPILVKSLQEAVDKIDTLEDRIEILESAIEMTVEGQLLDGTNASSTNAGSKVKLG